MINRLHQKRGSSLKKELFIRLVIILFQDDIEQLNIKTKTVFFFYVVAIKSIAEFI